MKQLFFLCGCCDMFHKLGWVGDCRDDANRFSEERIESLYGKYFEGWEEVEEDFVGRNELIAKRYNS